MSGLRSASYMPPIVADLDVRYQGSLEPQELALTFDINVTGNFLLVEGAGTRDIVFRANDTRASRVPVQTRVA